MKWTNHPRIFLEVALVKLCHQEHQSPSLPAAEDMRHLIKKIENLETELLRLKEQGISAPPQDSVSVQTKKNDKTIENKRI